MKRLLAAALAAVLVLSIAAPALAARGGKHAVIAAAVSCSITPDPVGIGQDFTVSGSGIDTSGTYASGDRFVFIARITKPSSMTLVYAFTDSAGTLEPFTFASWELGSVTVDIEPFTPDSGPNPAVANCSVTVT